MFPVFKPAIWIVPYYSFIHITFLVYSQASVVQSCAIMCNPFDTYIVIKKDSIKYGFLDCCTMLQASYTQLEVSRSEATSSGSRCLEAGTDLAHLSVGATGRASFKLSKWRRGSGRSSVEHGHHRLVGSPNKRVMGCPCQKAQLENRLCIVSCSTGSNSIWTASYGLQLNSMNVFMISFSGYGKKNVLPQQSNNEVFVYIILN